MGRISERAVEYAFVLQCLSEIYPATVLDVGPGGSALPFLMQNCGFAVQAIDKAAISNANKHFDVQLLDVVHMKLDSKFDFISCVSVLEHVSRTDAAMSNMVQMLNPGGYLALTFPYNEDRYIENVYKLEGAGYGQKAKFPCHIFCWENISKWTMDNDLKLEQHDRWQCFTGEYWTFGERVFPPVYASVDELHHLSCILLKKAT